MIEIRVPVTARFVILVSAVVCGGRDRRRELAAEARWSRYHTTVLMSLSCLCFRRLDLCSLEVARFTCTEHQCSAPCCGA